MVIVQFSPEVLTDLGLLPKLPINVFKELLKIALDSIANGETTKRNYGKVAESLGVESEAIDRTITALVQAFLFCSKRNVAAGDFRASFSEVSIPEESFAVLVEAYESHYQRIRTELSSLDVRLPHYSSVDWRLDLQIASRCYMGDVKPMFLLELETEDSNHKQHVHVLESDFANLRHVCEELEVAVKEVKNKHCNRIIRYVK